MAEKEDKIKYKACPLKNFDACIGSSCAIYDELKLIEKEDEIKKSPEGRYFHRLHV